MVRHRKNKMLLLLLLRTLRKTSDWLRRCADRLENYLDSARADTTEFVERTLAGARRLTREMQLKNGIRFLSFLTVALAFILIYISSRNTANVMSRTLGEQNVKKSSISVSVASGRAA